MRMTSSGVVISSDDVHLLQLTNPDRSERKRSSVITLHREMSSLEPPVLRPRAELARRDFRLPIRAPELVLEQLEPIEPVLHVRTARDDTRCIPLTHRLEMSRR